MKLQLFLQDAEGFTALMHATIKAFDSDNEPEISQIDRQNSIKSLEFILSKQPDFTLKNKNGHGVLWIATVNYKKCAQHDYIMHLLKGAQNGANISEKRVNYPNDNN